MTSSCVEHRRADPVACPWTSPTRWPRRPPPWPRGLRRRVPGGAATVHRPAPPGGAGGRARRGALVRRLEGRRRRHRCWPRWPGSSRSCSSRAAATRVSTWACWRPRRRRCGRWSPSARRRREVEAAFSGRVPVARAESMAAAVSPAAEVAVARRRGAAVAGLRVVRLVPLLRRAGRGVHRLGGGHGGHRERREFGHEGQDRRPAGWPRSTSWCRTAASETATSTTPIPGAGPTATWCSMALMTVLCLIGLVMVLSASSVQSLRQYGSPWHYFERQALWLALGAGGVLDCRRGSTTTAGGGLGASAVVRRLCFCWWRCCCRASGSTAAGRRAGSGSARGGCSRRSWPSWPW